MIGGTVSGATTKATLLGHKFSDTYATSTFAVDTFTLVGLVVLAIILRRSPQPEPPQYIAKLERQEGQEGVGEHMATNGYVTFMCFLFVAEVFRAFVVWLLTWQIAPCQSR